MTAPEPAALVAAMRNEGPFIVEWVAYHRAIGFAEVVICTNDCTDGSDTLLDALQAGGHATHLRNEVPEGIAPQHSAMTRAFAHLDPRPVEWLAHIDSDEFLDIGLGAGQVADLLARAGAADVIALPWQFFGDSGHTTRILPILPNFTDGDGAPDPVRVKFKSMFRFRRFRHADDHMPTGPRIDAPRVVAADGAPLRNDDLFAGKRAKYRPLDRAIAPGAAVLNHYATRAADDFLMKNDRGDGQGKTDAKYHLGSRWHRIANRSGWQSRRILRHWPATAARMAAMRADPAIARAESDCLAHDDARRAAILTPATRRRWTRYTDSPTKEPAT